MLRGPVQWKRALPVAIIAALCAVPLAEALVGKDALYARDVSILFWSTRTFAARSFDQGRLPGWDPRSQCGMPFLGNAPTGVLYPPTALFSVLPFPRAYAWFVYLHQVFGACGVFVLLRRLQPHLFLLRRPLRQAHQDTQAPTIRLGLTGTVATSQVGVKLRLSLRLLVGLAVIPTA